MGATDANAKTTAAAAACNESMSLPISKAKLHCIATDSTTAAAYQTKKKECEATVRKEYILIVVLFSSFCTDSTEHWQSALCRHFFFFGLL